MAPPRKIELVVARPGIVFTGAGSGVRMDASQDQFQRLLREAQDDPQIIGVVLTGSRGKGFGGEASDFDVLLVVQPEALEAYRTKFYDDESWRGLRLVGDVAAGARAGRGGVG